MIGNALFIVHAILCRHLPADSTPELPRKTIRLGNSKFDKDFIESRRAGLEGYLIQLVGTLEPERLEALDDFLEYAEHCLIEAIANLGTVTELSHVVRMLKGAADAAAAVMGGGSTGTPAAVPAAGAGARPAGARRRSDASDAEADDVGDGDDGGGAATPSAPRSALASSALLPTLREVARMMREYAGILRSGAEDAAERADATASSVVHLSSRLRGQEEAIGETRQLVAALRERRRVECERERSTLLLGATQARTVLGELRRVLRERSLLRITTAAHTAACERARGGDGALSEWERGVCAGRSLLLDSDAAAESATAVGGGAPAAAAEPVAAELRGQSSALEAAADAAADEAAVAASAVPTALELARLALCPPSAAAAAPDSDAADEPDALPPPATLSTFVAAVSPAAAAAALRASPAGALAVDARSVIAAASGSAAYAGAAGVASGANAALVLSLAAVAADNAHLARLCAKLAAGAAVRSTHSDGGRGARGPGPTMASQASLSTSDVPRAAQTDGAAAAGAAGGGFAAQFLSSQSRRGVAAPVQSSSAAAAASSPLLPDEVAPALAPGGQGVDASRRLNGGSGLNPHFRSAAAGPAAGPAAFAAPDQRFAPPLPAAASMPSAAAATNPAPSAAVALMREKLASAAAGTSARPGNPFGGGGGSSTAPGGNPF